uniref:hypothetical protein n=1 Tax=Klebsiella michiganensis TaxID=1134687 RepID=UPI0012B8EFD3
IIRTPTTSLKTSIKTITNLSDTNCLEIQGASLGFLMTPVSLILLAIMFALVLLATLMLDQIKIWLFTR